MSKARDLANLGSNTADVALDSEVVLKSLVDAKADLITATAADTPARLAVGTNGQVLTADSTTATGLKWGDAAGGSLDFQLLNAGGTALTGATTITVSGISNKKALFIRIYSASSVNSNSEFGIRFNGDTGSTNYYYSWIARTGTAVAVDQTEGSSAIQIANTGSANTDSSAGYMTVLGTDKTGLKPLNWSVWSSGTTNNSSRTGVGAYAGTSAITSVSIISSNGNFDAGTIYIYGA